MTSVYLFCTALGFVFTVGGALLGHFVGGHDGHGLGHGHGDAGGHGHGHGHGHDQNDGAHHLPLLSPAIISCYVTCFGASGLAYQKIFGEQNVWLHAPLAAVTGVGLGVGAAFVLWKVTQTFDSNRMARQSDALAAPAEVTVSVPESGMGEIAYQSGGTRQTLSAKSADGRAHRQGSQVRVVRIGEGIAFVSEAPDAPPAAGVGEPLPRRTR